MITYGLTRSKIKEILFSLKKHHLHYLVEDIDYLEYGDEKLLVCNVDKKLIDFYGREKVVKIYIKIKLKSEDKLLVISFYESEKKVEKNE